MPAAQRPRVLSGIQPTADSFHLGNYLGALRHWVALQDDHDAFYCVADLHALTITRDPAALRRRTRVAAAQLLALGLDPDRATLFVQSHVLEHAELTWVLSCLTGFGEASRMTQFKDKAAREGAEQTTVGVFSYPVLMAADILLYQAAAVPVGEDQRQHLELTRTLATRFNNLFAPTLRLPEAYIVRDTARITDLAEPTAKMSKSLPPAGRLDLLEEPAALRRKVRRAVTDPGSEIRVGADKPGITNLLTIYAGLAGQRISELETAYAGRGYGELKRDLGEVVVDFVTPVQERTRRYLTDVEALDTVLAHGAKRARAVAADTMSAVREAVGFVAPREA